MSTKNMMKIEILNEFPVELTAPNSSAYTEGNAGIDMLPI